jgi:hypothetical protein
VPPPRTTPSPSMAWCSPTCGGWSPRPTSTSALRRCS